MLLVIPRAFRALYKILQTTLNVQEHASSGWEDGEARVQFGVSDLFSPVKSVSFLPFLLIFAIFVNLDFLSFLLDFCHFC